ncbi:MAG: outer membrane lipoprotein chaperone LolA [Xanthomonadales bacterium]|nr:outer membrane lipoprotein chaperone LolA [Xanthomonadales bacterium]
MRTILILGLSWAMNLAASDNDGPAMAELQAFSSGLETLHAGFNQRVIGPDGALQSEGAGSVWMQHPGLFRWSYEGEYPELIVADGERVWIYDEMLEQVTVKAQSSNIEDSPLLLLTQPQSLAEQFEVTELGAYEDMQLLSLVSHDPESEFERILLGFAQDQLRLMALEDAFGLRTEIRFDQVRRNPGLDPELFRFTPPEGSDVVGDTEPPALQ